MSFYLFFTPKHGGLPTACGDLDVTALQSPLQRICPISHPCQVLWKGGLKFCGAHKTRIRQSSIMGGVLARFL